MNAEASSQTQLLAEWHRRCAETQYGHYTAERFCTRLNYLFGIPVVALSALAGTSAFASLQVEQSSAMILFFTGVVSITAAVLASLQTFLRFSERAETHRSVAARYGAVKRRIEQMQAKTSATAEDTDIFIDNIRQDMDKLADEAPGVSAALFRRARAHLARTEKTNPD